MKPRKEKAGGPKPKSIFDGIPITFEGADCPYCANDREDALPVTQDVLDEQECGTPGCTCTVLEMSPQCHPDAGQLIFYCKVHGTIATFCRECHSLTFAFLIASSQDPGAAA